MNSVPQATNAKNEWAVESSAPASVTADTPTTLIEVFERIARRHKRSDTLNYKRDER